MAVEGSAPQEKEDVKFRCHACGTWIMGPRAHVGHGAPCPTCKLWVVVPYSYSEKEVPERPIALRIVDTDEEAVPRRPWERKVIGLNVAAEQVKRRIRSPRLAWIATLAALGAGYAVLRMFG